MGYITENLAEGEEVVFLTKRHWVNHMGLPTIPMIIGVLVLGAKFNWEKM